MPSEKRLLSDCLILKISANGERYLRIKLLCPASGVWDVLQRRSSKPSQRSHLDLFDQGEATIDTPVAEATPSGFLTDFTIEKKRAGLGKAYSRLRAASWIANLIASNPMHEESAAEAYELTCKALEALESGKDPDTILLKTLFVFARNEGYPVIEDWIQGLSSETARFVTQLINSRLESGQQSDAQAKHVFQQLCQWVDHETQIRLPLVN